MKLLNYRCKKCGKDHEVFEVNDKPEDKPEKCDDCGGELVSFNFKNNSQIWKFNG